MDRKGHPLPRSKEARHNEIPEHLVQEKGRGDDPPPVLQPSTDPVTPDGEPYRYGDLGRGPEPADRDEMSSPARRHEAEQDRKPWRSGSRAGEPGGGGEDELRHDQAERQDRGQSIAEAAAESDHG
jgi:hypothetical protein